MAKLDVEKASAYNDRASHRIWSKADLPTPFNHPMMSTGHPRMAFAVAAFQSAVGLVSDGKLGPSTLGVLRSKRTIGEALHADCPAADDGGPIPLIAPIPSVKPRSGVSGILVINGSDVPIQSIKWHAGWISCSNWKHDDDHHFRARPRSGPMKHFVLHESVTTSVTATVRVLKAKRRRKGYDYGIHFCIAPDGHIHQHNDPVLDRLVHASQLNDSSAGVEITNPYNPKFGGAPWTDIIPGPWWCWKPRGAERLYTKPTYAQELAVELLCCVLVKHCPDLPLEFPTRNLNARKPRIRFWRDKAYPAPGIVAHRDFAAHADGRYPLEELMKVQG